MSSEAAFFEQEFLRPGHYRIAGKLRAFTKEDLGQYQQGTTKALAAGLSIPVLRRHVKPGVPEGGPQLSASKSNALDGVGWLRSVKQDASGALSHQLEITDPEARKSFRNGSVRHTSPELAPNYIDGLGRPFGPTIRHVALTLAPRNPDQGPILPFSEVMQFSLDDFVDPSEAEKMSKDPQNTQLAEDNIDKKKTNEESGDGARQPDPELDNAEDTPLADEQKTNETTTSPVDIGALAMEVAAKVGAIVPEGVDVTSPEAMAIILTAILNAKGGEEEAAPAELETLEETPNMAQFSEEAQAVIAKDRAAIAGLQEDLAAAKKQTASANDIRRRTSLAADIDASGIPPAAGTALKSRAETVQFSDEDEQASWTTREVLTFVKESFPGAFQLAEDDIDDTKHPEGEQFQDATKTVNSKSPVQMSEEEARTVADELDAAAFKAPRREDWVSPLAGTHPGVVAPEAAPAAPTKRKRGRPRKTATT